MEPVEFSPEWFDYSSKMWLQNKKKCGQSYVYVCKKDKCKNKPYKNTDICYWHMQQSSEGTRKSQRLMERNKEKTT